MGSTANYGGFAFLEDELNLVALENVARLSPRGKRLNRDMFLRCKGEVQGASLAAILSRMNAIESALTEDGQDFSYLVNGTPAHSLLNSADCTSGVQVVRRGFPQGDRAELATRRTFSFVLKATYDTTDQNDDLISWQESVEKIGTGGPRWYVLETSDDIPRRIDVTLKSAVTYRQLGKAVGYFDYPDFPGPVNPAGEHEPSRRERRISGVNVGRAFRFYTSLWSYTMFRDPSTFGDATFFPTTK